MGAAIIDAHLGGGLYRVRLQFDNAAVDQRLALIAAQLVDIDKRLADLAAEKAAALIKYQAAAAALNAYLTATAPEKYIADAAQIDQLTEDLYRTKAPCDMIASNINREKLRKKGLEKDRDYLNKYCPAEITAQAWCVQRVETLSGTVGCIEIDYCLQRDPITQQIRNDSGVWLLASGAGPDTWLQHPMASGPAAVWFNLGILPAAQRDRGRYRVATIVDVVARRVQFDGQWNTPEHSSRLVNLKPIFPVIRVGAAPISFEQREYADGVAFENPCAEPIYQDGDRVIVDVNPLGTPTVIGFYSHPPACKPPVEVVVFEAVWALDHFYILAPHGDPSTYTTDHTGSGLASYQAAFDYIYNSGGKDHYWLNVGTDSSNYSSTDTSVCDCTYYGIPFSVETSFDNLSFSAHEYHGSGNEPLQTTYNQSGSQSRTYTIKVRGVTIHSLTLTEASSNSAVDTYGLPIAGAYSAESKVVGKIDFGKSTGVYVIYHISETIKTMAVTTYKTYERWFESPNPDGGGFVETVKNYSETTGPGDYTWVLGYCSNDGVNIGGIYGSVDVDTGAPIPPVYLSGSTVLT